MVIVPQVSFETLMHLCSRYHDFSLIEMKHGDCCTGVFRDAGRKVQLTVRPEQTLRILTHQTLTLTFCHICHLFIVIICHFVNVTKTITGIYKNRQLQKNSHFTKNRHLQKTDIYKKNRHLQKTGIYKEAG